MQAAWREDAGGIAVMDVSRRGFFNWFADGGLLRKLGRVVSGDLGGIVEDGDEDGAGGTAEEAGLALRNRPAKRAANAMGKASVGSDGRRGGAVSGGAAP